MSRVGNIDPCGTLGQIKLQAMVWRNGTQMGVRITTSGEDVRALLHCLLIDSSAGIACAEDHQRELLG